MRPFLFSIGSTQIPSFFFFLMIATLAATFYLYAVAPRHGFHKEVALDMGMIGMISGVLGGRIFHILVEAPAYYWEKPMRVFEFWRGGFVSYGAFIAIVVSLWVYFRIRKLPLAGSFDLLATGAPIVEFFVHVACLLTGCCYGKPTNLPWAITFHNPASTAYYFYPNTPLHPTQIYSIIHAVLLFIFINWAYRHRRSPGSGFPGQTACLLVMGWTLPRAFIEMFRGDTDRGVYFSGLLSTAQITGGLLFLIAFFVYRHLAVKYRVKQP